MLLVSVVFLLVPNVVVVVNVVVVLVLNTVVRDTDVRARTIYELVLWILFLARVLLE